MWRLLLLSYFMFDTYFMHLFFNKNQVITEDRPYIESD
jgi:hypothetical protein